MSGKTHTAHDTAGSIRAAGDGFSKMEIAHEEEYFYKLVKFISKNIWGCS